MTETIKLERRGRPRTRPIERWNEIERNYIKEYVRQRRNDPNDAFKLIQSRTYYRRVLKSIDETNPKFEKITQKISDLDEKINERQSQRVRYQKQNILNKSEF